MRFRGEWKTLGHLTAKRGEESNLVDSSSSAQATLDPAKDDKLAAPELQVTEVEILGSSDPQVRTPSSQPWTRPCNLCG